MSDWDNESRGGRFRRDSGGSSGGGGYNSGNDRGRNSGDKHDLNNSRGSNHSGGSSGGIRGSGVGGFATRGGSFGRGGAGSGGGSRGIGAVRCFTERGTERAGGFGNRGDRDNRDAYYDSDNDDSNLTTDYNTSEDECNLSIKQTNAYSVIPTTFDKPTVENFIADIYTTIKNTDLLGMCCIKNYLILAYKHHIDAASKKYEDKVQPKTKKFKGNKEKSKEVKGISDSETINDDHTFLNNLNAVQTFLKYYNKGNQSMIQKATFQQNLETSTIFELDEFPPLIPSSPSNIDLTSYIEMPLTSRIRKQTDSHVTTAPESTTLQKRCGRVTTAGRRDINYMHTSNAHPLQTTPRQTRSATAAASTSTTDDTASIDLPEKNKKAYRRRHYRPLEENLERLHTPLKPINVLEMKPRRKVHQLSLEKSDFTFYEMNKELLYAELDEYSPRIGYFKRMKQLQRPRIVGRTTFIQNTTPHIVTNQNAIITAPTTTTMMVEQRAEDCSVVEDSGSQIQQIRKMLSAEEYMTAATLPSIISNGEFTRLETIKDVEENNAKQQQMQPYANDGGMIDDLSKFPEISNRSTTNLPLNLSGGQCNTLSSVGGGGLIIPEFSTSMTPTPTLFGQQQQQLETVRESTFRNIMLRRTMLAHNSTSTPLSSLTLLESNADGNTGGVVGVGSEITTLNTPQQTNSTITMPHILNPIVEEEIASTTRQTIEIISHEILQTTDRFVLSSGMQQQMEESIICEERKNWYDILRSREERIKYIDMDEYRRRKTRRAAAQRRREAKRNAAAAIEDQVLATTALGGILPPSPSVQHLRNSRLNTINGNARESLRTSPIVGAPTTESRSTTQVGIASGITNTNNMTAQQMQAQDDYNQFIIENDEDITTVIHNFDYWHKIMMEYKRSLIYMTQRKSRGGNDGATPGISNVALLQPMHSFDISVLLDANIEHLKVKFIILREIICNVSFCLNRVASLKNNIDRATALNFILELKAANLIYLNDEDGSVRIKLK